MQAPPSPARRRDRGPEAAPPKGEQCGGHGAARTGDSETYPDAIRRLRHLIGAENTHQESKQRCNEKSGYAAQ